MAIRYWAAHDGYRDTGDNLSIIVEAAYAKGGYGVLAPNTDIRFVFGDTTDEGQFRLQNNINVSIPLYFDDRLNAQYSNAQQQKKDVARVNYLCFKISARTELV